MTSNKIENSPTAKINALSDSFNHVLERGQQYVDLLDQLAQTDDWLPLKSWLSRTCTTPLLTFHSTIRRPIIACFSWAGCWRCITSPA